MQPKPTQLKYKYRLKDFVGSGTSLTNKINFIANK
jgi:hypothetical protein